MSLSRLTLAIAGYREMAITVGLLDSDVELLVEGGERKFGTTVSLFYFSDEKGTRTPAPGVDLYGVYARIEAAKVIQRVTHTLNAVVMHQRKLAADVVEKTIEVILSTD